MSNTQTQRTLAKAQERVLNTLCCIGYVSEVGDVKVTESGNYIGANFKLAGLRGSRNSFHTIYLRPEWLMADYTPDDEVAESFMFRKVMGTQSTLGGLEGILGKELVGAFLTDLDSRGAITPDTLRESFVKHFASEAAGNKIGYILKQKNDKTEDINPDTGKNVYVRTNNYEVSEWFDAGDPKKIKSMVKRAEKEPKEGQPKFIIGFELD